MFRRQPRLRFREPRSFRAPRATLWRWSGWFAWLNGLLAGALATRFIPFMQPLDTLFAKFYVGLAIVGHFELLALTGSLSLLALALLVPNRAVIFPLGIVLGSIAMWLLALDTAVYQQYRFHLNAFVFALVMDAGNEVFEFSLSTWLVGSAAALGVVLLESLLAWLAWRRVCRPRSAGLAWLAAALALLPLLGSHLIHIWADANYTREITALSRHLPVYRPSTAKNFLYRRGWVDPALARRERAPAPRQSQSLAYPLQPLQCTAPQRQLNLLLVLLDGWRADALDARVTPNLQAFLERSPVSRFGQHFSAGNGTRPGVFGLFYGLPASYWRAFYGAELPPVLMRTLLEQGYAMGIFASAKLTRPAFDRTVFSQLPDLRLASDGDSAWARDRDATDDFLNFLRLQDRAQPFFGFLFYDSMHAYSFPPDYPRQFEPIWDVVEHWKLSDEFDPLPYFNRYRQSLHYIDSLLGEVLQRLRDDGLLDSTVVVLTGDHGEEFNDAGQGYWGHGGNYSRYQTQVPMLVHWPARAASRYAHMTSHHDLAPTLLSDLLGCANPARDYSIGRTLFDTSERDAVLVSGHLQYGIVEPDRISALYQSGDFEIFDRDLRRLDGAELSPAVSRMVLDGMSRFYRR